MVHNDSFVYFGIRSGVKECNKIKSETMKERGTPINLSANTDYLHQFGNSTFKTQTNKT